MWARDGVVVLGDDEVGAVRGAGAARVQRGVGGDGEAGVRGGPERRGQGVRGDECGEVGEVVGDLEPGGLDEGRGGGGGGGGGGRQEDWSLVLRACTRLPLGLVLACCGPRFPYGLLLIVAGLVVLPTASSTLPDLITS